MKSRLVLSEAEVLGFSEGQDSRFAPMKYEFRIKKLELRMFSISFKTICLLIFGV